MDIEREDDVSEERSDGAVLCVEPNVRSSRLLQNVKNLLLEGVGYSN
jgi:hypothetical protein